MRSEDRDRQGVTSDILQQIYKARARYALQANEGRHLTPRHGPVHYHAQGRAFRYLWHGSRVGGRREVWDGVRLCPSLRYVYLSRVLQTGELRV